MSYLHTGQARLLSPLECLTAVFGMGTGVSTPPSSPDRFLKSRFPASQNWITTCASIKLTCLSLWSSPRPISISQLHISLCFHLWPIYLVVFKGSYFFRMGNLILESVSRLDAFSAYPFPTWLPSYALGSTTGAPAVGPSRSSRTKDSSPQISFAHNR